MCLQSKWLFPKRTKKDITCYKVLSEIKGKYITPFTHTNVDIEKPFIAQRVGYNFNPFRYSKGEGYIHMFTDLIYAKKCARSLFGINAVIFRCHIPKGTKYHISVTGLECCSKVIIFDRIISSYELYNIC